MTTRSRFTTRMSAAVLAASLLTLAACSDDEETDDNGAGNGDTNTAANASQVDEDFDLDALIEAAEAEGPITIYDNTSKVETMAENFTAKYGIEATGVKVDASEAFEMVTREAESGNVQGDVIALPDMAALQAQLLPDEIVYSWIPGDLVDNIDESQRDPLVLIHDPSLWAYNSEVYDTCPVTNMWELTEEEWTGKVALEDPVGSNKQLDWFSQMEQFNEADLRAAYEDHFGEDLDADSAVEEWVARMAANDPILTNSHEDVSAAVGAPGQEDPPMGLMSSAKFRNIEEQGYVHDVCADMAPWAGYAAPKAMVIASESQNQNAAKLFVHFALTEEGIEPQINDGKISSNTTIEQPEDPADVRGNMESIYFFNNEGLTTDWQSRQDWQDLWRTSAN